MGFVEIFFALAVAWFTYVCLRVAALIVQFLEFPGTFGRTTNVSLADLSVLSADTGEDLPAFRVVIPAYQEALVIEGTLRRAAGMNYPRSHFDIWVVTYEDEPPEPGLDSTHAVASRAAAVLNGEAGRNLVRVLRVPSGFDGRFPGTLEAAERFVGKPRGLNFALRAIHESIEREERSFYIGAMARAGRIAAVDAALDMTASALAEGPAAATAAIARHFDPGGTDHAGPCVLSRHVQRVRDLLEEAQSCTGLGEAPIRQLQDHLAGEAGRFFYRLETGPGGGTPALAVMEDRRFLFDVMCSVEGEDLPSLEAEAARIEQRLGRDRPKLAAAIARAEPGEGLFQLARRIQSRWVAVYDADADPPAELFRHLAARILTDPQAMGFQGPVSPVANYEAVHPLCKLGGLWMGFWHTTGYPRLLSRGHWAHVLAGTNWCFRLDGFEWDRRLVRDVPYDEARRRFVLSFDPAQLTEDLEVAVRVFSDWRINAAWHPFVEFEQVPASPGAMVVQRRRWTLGTLQTIAYMLRSNLPPMQKLKYAFLPLDIVVSGTGPIVTILLWVLVYSGDVVTRPLLMAWSAFLTFGNLVYVVPYLLAHRRFVLSHRLQEGMEAVLTLGPAVARDASERLRAGGLLAEEAEELRRISDLFAAGLRRGGFVPSYLRMRSLEDDRGASEEADRLLHDTPGALGRAGIANLAGAFALLAQEGSGPASVPRTAAASLARRLAALTDALEQCAVRGRWRNLCRRERLQIWLWAFVYLFFQLIPYYQGLAYWLTGRSPRRWNKTPRTAKAALPSSGET